ncbi:MAG: hypothetical protein NVS4B12_17460 [Ktedonobacteraceae bacterium]
METHQPTEAVLRDVARLHVRLQREQVDCCGGTTVAQCTLLTELGRSGSIPLAELSRRLDLDKGWISRTVEQLVEVGLVEKVPSTTDRRMVSISLSPVGEDRLHELNETLNGQAEKVMNRIPSGKREGVRTALLLLQGALRAELEEGGVSYAGTTRNPC